MMFHFFNKKNMPPSDAVRQSILPAKLALLPGCNTHQITRKRIVGRNPLLLKIISCTPLKKEHVDGKHNHETRKDKAAYVKELFS